jgi:uncharacterized protein (DUF1501 family)
MFSRRSLLAFSLALAAAPRRARAADASNHRFLFIFARGGWDPTWVFAPGLSPDRVDGDPGGLIALVGGLPIVDNPNRPSVRRTLERYGDQTAFINGLEVRSLTHERCRRLLFCGAGEGEADDWAVNIAAADPRWTLPHLVLTGPSFTASHGASVVRLGANNQLSDLLSGEFVYRSDTPLLVPSPSSSAAARAFARARAEAWAAKQERGQPAALSGALVSAYGLLDVARENATLLDQGELGTDALVSVPDRVVAALQCFEQGYSRCALVEHQGLFDRGWDTHSDNDSQNENYELLFSDLELILDSLSARAGAGGGSLLDETTVVVLSEMGRSPRLNSAAGKDHWTFTSAMLIGAGVRGGVVAGAFDDDLRGQPIDLATGNVEPDGEALTPEHIGATLYALAGLEPRDLVNADPIGAVLAEG